MDMIGHAFQKNQRRDFVPESLRDRADVDAPLPIGFGQTNSQPSTVRRMLEWLDAQPGDKVLDVGSGSGWTTALLSSVVGPTGRVFAVELVPELVKVGRNNCETAGVINAKFFQAGEEYGSPKYSPYDRILVSASAAQLPQTLLDQLRIGGKLVIPVENDILEIIKTSDREYDIDTHPGFVFVPLI